MYARKSRNRWNLFLLLLAGMVLGSALGYYLKAFPFLRWLDYGQPFGFTSPVTLSLGFLSVTFGFVFNINVAGLIGILLAVAAYKLSERF